MSANIQWEYLVENVGSFWRSPNPGELQTYLNELGIEGWELVNLHHVQNSNKVWITLKRQLTTATRRRRSLPGDRW
jgi:hypothetical protein